jgi:hypothetical protein
MTDKPDGSARGLAPIEIGLFVFGVLAFALLMLAFGAALPRRVQLPVVALWIVGGLGFVWWFNGYLARRPAEPVEKRKVRRISSRRRPRR